jgi:hypothetical protein
LSLSALKQRLHVGGGNRSRSSPAGVTERGKDDAVTAFTEDGIENLKQIIADMRANGRAPSPRFINFIAVSRHAVHEAKKVSRATSYEFGLCRDW